jgi:hypothetical protein
MALGGEQKVKVFDRLTRSVTDPSLRFPRLCFEMRDGARRMTGVSCSLCRLLDVKARRIEFCPDDLDARSDGLRCTGGMKNVF